jgi:hypothetical protein
MELRPPFTEPSNYVMTWGGGGSSMMMSHWYECNCLQVICRAGVNFPKAKRNAVLQEHVRQEDHY